MAKHIAEEIEVNGQKIRASQLDELYKPVDDRGTEQSKGIRRLAGGVRGHLSTYGAVSLNPNDTAWSIMYGALINTLGASPNTFQLVYPMTSWNWPTNNPGYTSAAQYDFCSVMPQWSATGGYVSSGVTFDGGYQQFLNTILLYTTNPTLQQQILAAQNNLVQASQNLQIVVAQSVDTYNSTVKNNVPTYTDWLGTPAGLGYATQINSLSLQVTQAQNVVNQLALEQTTPNIANALAAYANPAYYTKLVDPVLSGFPPVPAWSLAQSSQQWVNQVQGGGGTPGSITFANSQAAYNYQNTWAQGSTSVGNFFWSVYASGSWQQCTQFQSDSSLSCTISFKAWDTIGITPSKWYSGTTAFKNGPFYPGYSAYAQPGTAYMFGSGGIVPLVKTGMLVCYQPTITITTSQSTYQSFQKQWSAAGGVQVGPFQIGGSSGGQTLNWTSSGSSMQLQVVSTSLVPLIFGVNVAVEPK
jgi:hypothetical protein